MNGVKYSKKVLNHVVATGNQEHEIHYRQGDESYPLSVGQITRRKQYLWRIEK